MEFEPEESVEVSVAEESSTPKESVYSGSECALVQPEGDGCHRAVPPCYCIVQMNTTDFNRALKITFILLLGAVLTTFLGLAVFQRIFVVTKTIGLFAVLFALCVVVERPGFKCRLIPKWMVTWTRYITLSSKSTTTGLQQNYSLTTSLHSRDIECSGAQ